MQSTLSKKQSEVLTFVKEFMHSNGESPSLREIMQEIGVGTKKSAAFHLDALERKGYIRRTGGARGIRLIEMSTDFMHVPLLGYANAGEPLLLAEEEHMGELMIDKSLVKGKRKIFGVELKGDSMDQKELNGVPMRNGNYAIIAKDIGYDNDDVVLAIINEGATVKVYKQESDMVVLYPESSNPIHKPIYLNPDNQNMIAGKVVTVLNNPALEAE